MISIIIPILNNKREYLQQSLNSIFGQTYNDYEIIYVNNGSSNEDTLLFLKEIRDLKNIIIINTKDKNNSELLNLGINSSTGEYITIFDGNDIMYPQKLKKQLDYIISNDVDLVGTFMKSYINEGNNIWRATNNIISQPEIITSDIVKKSTTFVNYYTIFFKKSSVVKVGLFNETLSNGLPEDFELYIRMLKNNMKIHNIQDSLLYNRVLNTQMFKRNRNVHDFLEKLRCELI